jgi:(1->4)-alpha-D-glucan 1-alpha-D-glucosylmutase
MAELRCTYRLQLLPHLDFRRARELVPYLRRLGVSHLYLSPAMQARRGSTHGYDVVDPTRLSDELGGEAEFLRLAEAGLGIVLDFVPNHMAASESENPFWADPLTRAKFFDVEWRTGWVRRFFDIGDLAGVRMEDPEVFEVTHAKLISLVRDAHVDGVRIDHVDGLANPARYLERLHEAGIGRVWVEKIVARDEPLRTWPVEGTTGYDFANDVVALFVDGSAREPLLDLYHGLTGGARSFHAVAAEAKLEQARSTFRPELDWLAATLADAGPEVDMAEAVSSLEVYRMYVDPDAGYVDDLDRQAVAVAGIDPGLARILLLDERGHDAFVIRFQQTTPAVVAKGVEDTALYRYVPLLCLNDVGSDPDLFSLPVDAFHAANAERLRRFPNQLLSTQTHDTKRSGDVRARLCAISWCAGEWIEHVHRWRTIAGGLRDGRAPDAAEEYLLYQTLAGAWPIELDGLEPYLTKALREAKVNTSWVDPDERWEGAVLSFARALVRDAVFLRSFVPLVERLAVLGERISLAQTALKLTCPGVPDIYQGDELYSFNLVDPDNRRAVDWAHRRRLLGAIEDGAPPTRESAKLFLIRHLLDLRARRPDVFAEGGYAPLDAGPDVCAFSRGGEVVVAVPLRPGGTFEPPSGFRDVLGADLGVQVLERI